MDLIGVRIELPTNTPILLLREQAPNPRLLPIFIGAPEATAIALALEGVDVPRPMTHDLIKVILDHIGVALRRVVVTELRDKTFFAELELGDNGRTKRVSCRPSDAIAVAVRCGAPIFAAEAVMEEAGYWEPEEADSARADPETDPDEVVEQFREFIDTVRPEDFES
jgi:hypothetical protein